MLYRPLISLLMFNVTVMAGEDKGKGVKVEPLTSLTEAQMLPRTAFNISRPLSLTGIVTLADAERNILVIQDGTRAIALHPDPPEMPVLPGQRVELRAEDCAPYVPYCPSYPFTPSGSDVQTSFEISTEMENHRLTRMRGWLLPPKSGSYTFWIASDDSSELWLSSSSDPSKSRRVAHVDPGSWTAIRQWDRFSSQRSETVQLQAGKAYYIEALQEQQTGDDHLAVAWMGPDLPQAVIAGQYLTPWTETGEVTASSQTPDQAKGIQREYWKNYSAGNLAPILAGVTNEGGLTVRGLQIRVLDEHVWPEPLGIQIGQAISANDFYRWVEGEGAVTFLSTDGVSASLEITEGANRLLVRVARWEGDLPRRNSQLRARFQGVCEGGHGFGGPLVASIVWSLSQENVTFFEVAGVQPPVPQPYPPDAAQSAFPGYYFTRGVVTFNDRVRGKDLLYVQDSLGGILISQDKPELTSQLRTGQLVEIGGPMVPGKFAPGIQPWSVNVVGWQNMPFPASPLNESAKDGIREGQWTEMEGVVRSITVDGAMRLMGKNSIFLLWLNGDAHANKQPFINSRLRARGVMSLDTFNEPTLLVPSQNFIEIAQPAPKLPEEPTPIAHLTTEVLSDEWTHQKKILGAVTYCGEHSFFLQDDTGGIRVHPLNSAHLKIGDAIQAIGFLDRTGATPQLTEAIWSKVEYAPAITHVILDPSHLTSSHSNALVRLDARLLGQKSGRDSLILELQSGRQVFEAVLTPPAQQMPTLKEGSTVRVTGVCITKPPNLSGGQTEATAPALALANILLRSSADVTLLQGPPWWTLKRTATLIGLLFTVLVATVLRIQFLNRRFALQKEARLTFARSMLENQENERRRIAASLHDSLGQDLLVIRNQTHRALQAATSHPMLRQRLEDISSTTLQAINEVREIAHNLRPYQLDRLGLTQAIRAIVRKVSENSPIDLASHVDEIDHLFDKDSEIHIYRIVQEGINNILKHSEATEAAVVIKHHPNRVSISIRDNGRGIAMDPRWIRDGGFGLGGIQERAKIMNGSTTIDSSPGQGVNLQVELPISTNSECATK